MRRRATHTPPRLNSFIPPTDGAVRSVDNRAASYHTPPSFPCVYRPNDGVFLPRRSLRGKGKPTPHRRFGGRIPPAVSTTTTGQRAIYMPPCSISFIPPVVGGISCGDNNDNEAVCNLHTALVFFLFPPQRQQRQQGGMISTRHPCFPSFPPHWHWGGYLILSPSLCTN